METANSLQMTALVHNAKLRHIPGDSNVQIYHRLELNYLEARSTRVMLFHDLEIPFDLSAQRPAVLIAVPPTNCSDWLFLRTLQVMVHNHLTIRCYAVQKMTVQSLEINH